MSDQTDGLLREKSGIAAADIFDSVRRMGAFPAIALFLAMALAAAGAQLLVLRGLASDGLEQLAKGYDSNLPALHVEDGRATVEGEEPAVFPKPGTPADQGKRFTIIYDTTGQIETIPDEYEGGILVTRDSLVLKGNRGDVQEIPLEEVQKITGDFTLNGDSVRKQKDRLLGLATMVLGFVLAIYNPLAKLFQVFILGIIGVLATSNLGNITFGESFKIAIASLVPAVVLQVFQVLSGLHLPSPLLIYLAVAGTCAFIGARQASMAKAARQAREMDRRESSGGTGPAEKEPAIFDRVR